MLLGSCQVFFTNGSFSEILIQNSWISGLFVSSYQGLLLEEPGPGWWTEESHDTGHLTNDFVKLLKLFQMIGKNIFLKLKFISGALDFESGAIALHALPWLRPWHRPELGRMRWVENWNKPITSQSFIRKMKKNNSKRSTKWSWKLNVH